VTVQFALSKHCESFADPLKPGNPRKVFVHDISGNHPCLKFRFIKEPFDGMKANGAQQSRVFVDDVDVL
jgi:hypothetical protein